LHRILSLSLVYPNPQEPGLGLFVRSRLAAMARRARVVAIAPVPLIDYSNPRGRVRGSRGVPSSGQDGDVPVFYPRWIYPPGGTPANVACLFLRLLGTVARLKRRFRFDLIDAHFGYPEGVAAALLAAVFGKPFTITVRGSEPMFGQHRYRGLCLDWALRRASAVIAVSESLRQFAISRGADPARTITIPNGIDASLFAARDRAACRASFGMGPAKAIVSAGEMIEAKGHHLIVEALRALIDGGETAELYIAGDVARGGAPFRKELVERIRALGMESHVHLLGWVNRDRLADLMTAADVFCLASFTEGWPNVVNEALACGTPVVATRVGAVPQMLPSEDYGSIVPARNVAALEEALGRALARSWDRDRIAAWGRSRSWDTVAEEVIGVMDKIMQENGVAVPEMAQAAPGAERN